MKSKYLALVCLLFSASFISCDKDEVEEQEPIAETSKVQLQLDKDVLEIKEGETASFTVLKGGGDYKVINENPNIAVGKITGNTVTVEGKRLGIAGLILSDASGNYRRITVKTMRFFKLKLDKETIDLGIKLGHTDGYAKISVLEGNGGYVVKSSNDDVVKVSSVSDDGEIVLAGIANGTANVTITDMMGTSKTVPVKVEETTIPYSEDEIKEFLSHKNLIVSWDNEKSYPAYGEHKATSKDGKGHIYWKYFSYMWCDVYFDGDLTVGKKTNGVIKHRFQFGSNESVVQPINVEILQVKDGYVWGMMSVVKDNYLHYGKFCVKL